MRSDLVGSCSLLVAERMGKGEESRKESGGPAGRVKPCSLPSRGKS